MLASFNYYPPPVEAVATAVGLAAIIWILVCLSGSVIISMLVTALTWGALAAGVAMLGRGDMTIIMMPFFGGIAAIAGAVLGGIGGFVVKMMRGRSKP